MAQPVLAPRPASTASIVPAGVSVTTRPNFPNDMEVLLLDTVQVSSDIARKLLTSCNYRVTACKNCHEAVDVIARKNIDLILAEMKFASSMDQGSMQLRAKAANIPLVLVSETGCAKDVWTSISFGAVDIMSCPLSRPKLQTLWQHVLRSQRSAMPSSLQMPARHVASVTKAPVPSVKMPLPPLKAQSPVDSRKRKAKDMTQTSMVAVRPPLAIKPGHSAHAMGMAISGGYQAAPSAPLVSYCVSPMVGISPVVSGARQVSWGQPVMGIPSSPHQPTVGVLPGQLGGFAFPQFVPYGHSTRLVSPVQIPASAAAPPSGSGVPLILPAGHKSNSVSSPVLACKTKAQKTESPGSPDAKSESCSSSVSDCSAIEDLICEDDLVTIPEPECFREVSPSPESSMSAEAPASCKPTSLDDISEEEYAFVDFALSDAFPAVDEDEILPPLGLALKKSDSLLNILNVQMVY